VSFRRVAGFVLIAGALGGLLGHAISSWRATTVFCDKTSEEPLKPKPAHIAALRKLRFGWDPVVESGAPGVDARSPYGGVNIVDDLAPIAGTRSAAALARFHVEVGRALLWALESASLPEGRYPVEALTNASMNAFLRRTLPADQASKVLAEAPPLDPDGTFAFSEDHRRLLRRLRLEWYMDESHVREPGAVFAVVALSGTQGWPQLMANPKRPFGDMTSFDLDMAEILGLPRPARDLKGFDPHLWRLYLEMWPALQTFVQHASFD
jgi:hypothetical protein